MRRKFLISILSVLFVMTGLISCNKEINDYEAAEKQEILDYLERNSTLNFELKPSGLYYLEQIEGTGRTLVRNDTAYVRYTVKFIEGQVFDSNVADSLPLKMVIDTPEIIKGFNEGLKYMALGGESMFLVPSYLAYGSYTPLIFEVKLVNVKLGPGK